MSTLRLTTPRLILTPLVDADVRDLHELWISPGVRRFLFDDKVLPLESTAANIATSTRLFAEQRYGLWGIRQKDSHGLIGFGGFWHFRGAGEREVLYGLAEETWNRGYATEVAEVLIAYGLDVLQMPAILASTDAGNTASIRVLEKLGFRLLRRAMADGKDTLFYAYARTDA